MKQGFGLGHATFNRCEELGEILSREILTNKQGECRLIQSSGILSIYLFRRHDIIYSFSFSYHFFSCNAEVHGRAAISKDKKKIPALRPLGQFYSFILAGFVHCFFLFRILR